MAPLWYEDKVYRQQNEAEGATCKYWLWKFMKVMPSCPMLSVWSSHVVLLFLCCLAVSLPTCTCISVQGQTYRATLSFCASGQESQAVAWVASLNHYECVIHQFCCSCTIWHVCVLSAETTMLYHCTLALVCTIALKTAMVYRLQASVHSLLPYLRIRSSNHCQLICPENLKASHVGIAKYNEMSSIETRFGSRRPWKIMSAVRETTFREAVRLIVIRSSFSISHGLNIATCRTFFCMCT